jgi:dipeptidyl aminopeptidase/acylaminoacyl peptidase
MSLPLTPETIIYDLATASDPQVSPDGARLLYTLAQAERGQKRPGSQIWLSEIDGSNARPFTNAGTRNLGARWSPDGTKVAFVSNRVPEHGLFVAGLDGGDPHELARHRVPIGAIAWSPDGRQIAYVAAFDPFDPNEEGNGDNPPRVRTTRRADYKQDNLGYLDDVRQQVWIVDLQTGDREMLTREPVDHLFPQWSPDGYAIAVKIPNRNGMHAQLALVDVPSGAVTRVGSWNGSVGCWSWSPDGSKILVAADEEQSWQLDFFLYDVATNTLQRLTDDLPCQPDQGFPTVAPPSQPVWLDDRRAIFHALRGGSSGIWEIDTATGAIDLLHAWRGMHVGLSSDRVGRIFAQGASSLDSTGEIATYDRETGEARIVTSVNADQLAETPMATWERFDIRRGDFTIEAWLLKPPGFDPTKSYPVVLDIHGGPNSWYGYGFNPMQQALAGAGFLVVFSNPRGSGSYGRHFTGQVRHDWGGEDYLDLMAVIDAVLERPYADPERTGVYGYSYGGFMSSWIIGQTPRFRAAVIGAPVVDLVSFYGTADIGHTFGPMQIGGTPDTNLEEYRKRSPLTYLKNATTPVLILHGEADDRVPIGQGEQLFQALLEHGVEVEFIRYPEGTHASVTRTGYPAHRLDYLTRLTDWFRHHLGSGQ